MISLRSAAMEVDIDDARGAQIVRLAASGGANALAWYEWESPAPSDPRFGDSELDWLAGYRGGWQETFPNAGQTSVVDGVPVAVHGEASTAPWTVEAVTATSCTVSVGCRLPLRLRRTMTVDAATATLRLESEVENIGRVPASFVWGHHPVFPAPPGARIELPDGVRIRPDAERAGGLDIDPVAWPHGRLVDGTAEALDVIPDRPLHRLLYVDGLAEGWAALRQPSGGVGVAMAWDLDAHPYSWLWIMRGDPGYPWYGRADVIGIECQTAWPYDGLSAARNRGMAHRLEPGGTLTSWYTITLLPDDDRRVAGVEKDGTIRWGAR